MARRKSKDISNRSLVYLLVIAIVISLSGTIAVMNRGSGITGAAVSNVTSGTGTTQFSVGDYIVVNLYDATINLGLLSLTETRNSEDVSDWFELSNDGSVNFDVYAYGVNSSASPFSSISANTLPNNYYKIHANESDSGTPNTAYVFVPAGAGNKALLVDDLDYQPGQDTAKIGVQVTIPADETTGAKNSDVVIYVEQA